MFTTPSTSTTYLPSTERSQPSQPFSHTHDSFITKSLAAGDVEQLMGGLEANELLGYDLILTGYTSSLDVGRETEAAVKRVLAASSEGRDTIRTFVLFCLSIALTIS